jgi:regulator of PEP synthase PpsR (kinase-PPPase family)
MRLKYSALSTCCAPTRPAANVPLVPGIPLLHQLEHLTEPLVVSLHATPERLIQVRQNRLLSMGAGPSNKEYVDRQAVADDTQFCIGSKMARHGR